MNIRIRINTDDDELDHECENEHCHITYNHMALGMIVEKIGRNIKRGRYLNVGDDKILDVNGNLVGKIEVME